MHWKSLNDVIFLREVEFRILFSPLSRCASVYKVSVVWKNSDYDALKKVFMSCRQEIIPLVKVKRKNKSNYQLCTTEV